MKEKAKTGSKTTKFSICCVKYAGELWEQKRMLYKVCAFLCFQHHKQFLLILDMVFIFYTCVSAQPHRATDYSASPLMNTSCLLYRIMSSSSVCWVISHQALWDYLVFWFSAEVRECGFNTQPTSFGLRLFSPPLPACDSPFTSHWPPHLQTPLVTTFDVVFALMYSRG